MSESPRLYIALYTDQDVTDELAIQLRKQGFNAQSAWEAGMSRANLFPTIPLILQSSPSVLALPSSVQYSPPTH